MIKDNHQYIVAMKKLGSMDFYDITVIEQYLYLWAMTEK